MRAKALQGGDIRPLGLIGIQTQSRSISRSPNLLQSIVQAPLGVVQGNSLDQKLLAPPQIRFCDEDLFATAYSFVGRI